MKTAIALVRVSTQDQDHERQVLTVRDWAASQGVQIELREEKRSGRDKVRPVLEQILAECRAGKVSCLVVSESSRLSRSLERTIQLLNELHELGVRVKILSLGWDFDPNTTLGSHLVRMLALNSELMLDLGRDATNESLAGGVNEKGKRISIYGNELGRKAGVIPPHTLTRARLLFASGMTAKEIVPHLEDCWRHVIEDGKPTTKPWYPKASTLLRRLKKVST